MRPGEETRHQRRRTWHRGGKPQLGMASQDKASRTRQCTKPSGTVTGVLPGTLATEGRHALQEMGSELRYGSKCQRGSGTGKKVGKTG